MPRVGRNTAGVAEKIQVRLAQADDFGWCVTQDDLVTEEVVKREIELNQIIVAEIECEAGDHLRLEYLWPNIPCIGLIFMREQC